MIRLTSKDGVLYEDRSEFRPVPLDPISSFLAVMSFYQVLVEAWIAAQRSR